MSIFNLQLYQFSLFGSVALHSNITKWKNQQYQFQILQKVAFETITFLHSLKLTKKIYDRYYNYQFRACISGVTSWSDKLTCNTSY